MRKAVIALLVVGFLTALAGVQMYRVHEQGWEWRLWPGAAPPKVHYDGSDYNRGGKQDAPTDMDLTVHGHTPGDGEILDTDHLGTTTLIWIRDGDTTWVYGLMGGP